VRVYRVEEEGLGFVYTQIQRDRVEEISIEGKNG